jgi:membrane protein DedA with SNARE-associated domain
MTNQNSGRRLKDGGRLVLPLIGVIVSLFIYLAQNVWAVFHVHDLAEAIRSLDRFGVLVALGIVAAIEGIVVFCFYLPGIPVIILVLLSLSPTWSEAPFFVVSLTTGTLLGYGVSLLLGHAIAVRFPGVVSERTFRRVHALIERYGLLSVIPAAFHPNHLALIFAALGYFGAKHTSLYFPVAAAAQLVWWLIYAATADTISHQGIVTGNNFPLLLATLFFVWLLFELHSVLHER